MASDVVCNAGTGIPLGLGTFNVKVRFTGVVCVLRSWTAVSKMTIYWRLPPSANLFKHQEDRVATYGGNNSQIVRIRAALRRLQHNRILDRKPNPIVVVQLRASTCESDEYIES